MAIYCANCGNQIRTGGKFCQGCGAPVPQPSPAEVMPQAPPRKSGGALKVVLITLGIIFTLFVVSMAGLVFFVKRAVHNNFSVKEGPNGQAEVSVNLPGGKLNISSKGKLSEEQLGVPIYPGAQAAEGSGSVSFSGSEEKSGSFSVATFTTEDDLDQVVTFYKDKLGSKVTAVESTDEEKHTAVLKVATEHALKTITIEEQDNGTTKITIASAVGKAVR